MVIMAVITNNRLDLLVAPRRGSCLLAGCRAVVGIRYVGMIELPNIFCVLYLAVIKTDRRRKIKYYASQPFLGSSII